MTRPIAFRDDDNFAIRLTRGPRRSDAIGESLRQAFRSLHTDERMQELLAQLNRVR